MKQLLTLLFILKISIMVAQEHDDEHLGKLSQQTSHPASDVSFLLIENETVFFDGEGFDEEPEYKTLLQPIFGLRIFDDKWTLAMRSTFEFLSAPHESHSHSGEEEIVRTSGFGDIGLMTQLSTKSGHEGFIWGLGTTAIFPTASDDLLGSGKYQLGPSASLFLLGEEYGTGLKSVNVGAFIEHWWSVAGDEDREETNHTSIQYFLMYRPTHTMLIGMEPKVTIDWKEESGSRLNFPIGLGIGDMFSIGKLPIKWRVEGQYYLESSEIEGEEFGLIFTLEPILSSLFN